MAIFAKHLNELFVEVFLGGGIHKSTIGNAIEEGKIGCRILFSRCFSGIHMSVRKWLMVVRWLTGVPRGKELN